MELEAGKVGPCKSGKKQGLQVALKVPGLESAMVERPGKRLGTIHEDQDKLVGERKEATKTRGPCLAFSPPSAPTPQPPLTSNVSHREAPVGGASVRVQQEQELVVA